MAVTAIWDIKGRLDQVVRYTTNPDKTEIKEREETAKYHTLDTVIQYTADEIKTEKQYYVSGVNCDSDPAEVVRQMNTTKETWHKPGGIICYHGYQSFAPGEVTPEQAHYIGVELAKRMWGDRFEVLVSTHLNTGKIHNHYVLNSISFADSLRYYDQKQTYRRLRELSDELCREYGLSVIENPQRGNTRHIGEVKAEEDGRYTVRGQIRRDIDEAIRENISFKYFWRKFESLGYTLEYRGKYLRARPDQSSKFFRLDKLGEGYTEDDIHDRLEENFRTDRDENFIPYQPKHIKVVGIRAQIRHYIFLLRGLPQTRPSNREIYEIMKYELKQLDMISKEAILLDKYQVDTAEQLHDFTESKSAQFKSLAIRRKKLRNQLRRMSDTQAMQPIKDEISALSEQMSGIRKEMKLCEDVAARSECMEMVVNTIEMPHEQMNERKESRKR